jgi:hypothetical protein
VHLTPQRSVVPSETISQPADPVIPDESAQADEIRNPAKVQYNQVFSGSRLASRLAGLGRDDELPHSLPREEGICSYRAELNTYAFSKF